MATVFDLARISQVGEVIGCSVGYGNYLGVGACDGLGVEAQVLEDVVYFDGDGEGPDMGARDRPGQGPNSESSLFVA